MKRKLGLDRVFIDFSGEEIKNNDQKFTLKDALLTYIRNSKMMSCSEQDLNTLYVLGIQIGTAKQGDLIVTTEEYDALKRLTDNGKITTPRGETEFIYPSIEISMQLKEIVDSAEIIPEETATNNQENNK